MQSSLLKSGSSRVCKQHHAPCRAPVFSSRPATARRAAPIVAAFKPPTVTETKEKFLQGYRKPVPAIYNVVLQELLVQHHFIRHSVAYAYNQIFALGFVSVFDQVMDGLPEAERGPVFNAYVSALGEDPARYRADAAAMEAQAQALGSADALSPSDSGNDLQKSLAQVAALSGAAKFAYNRFFAIGLFRLLELTGAKEPAALERLVKAVGVRPELVNKDLMTYKSVLSKMSAAKELMREYLEREKRKAAERAAAKVKAPEAAPAPATP